MERRIEMSLKNVLRTVVLIGMFGSFLAASGCSANKASVVRLTGDSGYVAHERHATGIESHSVD
jgi:hypothetical protein